MIALPQLEFSGPAEPFNMGDLPQACKPVPQVGVMFFRDWLRRNVGGGDLGIVSCDRPYKSDHFEGRAWDWRVFAHVPEEAAMAEAVLAWLRENDWEVFRRLGLKYVIWNRQRYAGGQVLPYTGANPHVDHVHFSFGWPGATGRTSFFPAAGFTDPGQLPPGYRPTPGPVPGPAPVEPPLPPDETVAPPTAHRAAAFVAAVVIGYGVVRIFA